jgi:hypothetical protein
MDFLWTDWRKTALGALALALAAVLFTHEGGVAETAVSGAEDLAGRKQAEIIAGAEAHKAWFAMDENSIRLNPSLRRRALPPLPSRRRLPRTWCATRSRWGGTSPPS